MFPVFCVLVLYCGGAIPAVSVCLSCSAWQQWWFQATDGKRTLSWKYYNYKQLSTAVRKVKIELVDLYITSTRSISKALRYSAHCQGMDHEHGTVCQPILEHQIRPSAPSSVISRPTCFSSSLHCCLQVGSAPFVRRRCDCSASLAPTINIQIYLLTYRCTQHGRILPGACFVTSADLAEVSVLLSTVPVEFCCICYLGVGLLMVMIWLDLCTSYGSSCRHHLHHP